MIVRHDPVSRSIKVGENQYLDFGEAKRMLIDLKRAITHLQNQIKAEALKAEARKNTERRRSLEQASRPAGAAGGRLIPFRGEE